MALASASASITLAWARPPASRIIFSASAEASTSILAFWARAGASSWARCCASIFSALAWAATVSALYWASSTCASAWRFLDSPRA